MQQNAATNGSQRDIATAHGNMRLTQDGNAVHKSDATFVLPAATHHGRRRATTNEYRNARARQEGLCCGDAIVTNGKCHAQQLPSSCVLDAILTLL